MESKTQYFVFSIDKQQYAIAVSAVEKVIRAVELNSIPQADDSLCGLVNVKGEIIPVMNIRKMLHLPERNMDINDRIVIARTSARKIAFIVDKLEGVVEFPPDRGDKAQQIIPEMAHCFEGVERFNGNTVFVYNIDKLFSNQNMKGLDLNAEHGPTHGP